MSKLAFLTSGTGVTVGAGATVVSALAVAGYVSGAFSTAPEPVGLVQPAASVVEKVAPETKPESVVSKVEVVEDVSVVPTFDVVRVETGGAAMIAGQAEAGSRVAIRLDQEIVATVKADASGKFASFVSLPESATAQVLTLDDGKEKAALEQVIIAPIVVVAPEVPETSVAEPAIKQPAKVVSDGVVAIVVPDIATDPMPKPELKLETVEVAVSVEPVILEPKPMAQAPVVLLATKEGVRVLQAPDAPKPDAMTALLGSISYDNAGDVALTGNARGSFVRVYLNNRAVATSQIASNGDWNAGLPEVDTGIYTLRVDELNKAGEVIARVETPFKREEPEVLAAATASEKLVQAITVQPGATLWAIAQERYGSGTLYARVVEANAESIKNPDLIYPGQVFTVPD